MRRGAERVAAMDERDPGGDRVKVQDPIQRRIAAADDHDPTAPEMLHLAYGIEHASVLVGVETGEGRLLRLERSAARGDEQSLGLDRLIVVGSDAKQRRVRRPENLHPLDHLAEVKVRPERMDLLHQIVDEFLSVDHRKARNVVDRLLGIEFRALAARLRQDVDQVGPDVEQAQFEDGEQADRPGADDRDVGREKVGHVGFLMLLILVCRAWSRRGRRAPR